MKEYKHPYISVYVEKDGRTQMIHSKVSATTWGAVATSIFLVMQSVTYAIAHEIGVMSFDTLQFSIMQMLSLLILLILGIGAHWHYSKKMKHPSIIKTDSRSA